MGEVIVGSNIVSSRVDLKIAPKASAFQVLFGGGLGTYFLVIEINDDSFHFPPKIFLALEESATYISSPTILECYCMSISLSTSFAVVESQGTLI
jgi:hypothetical protein